MSASQPNVQRAAFDEVMVPTYAPAAFIPVRGEGSRVWDQADREYVDFAGGIAVSALGHGHPALIDALTEQAGKLWHVSNIYTNEPALRLARKLVDHTFADRVFFANSGAEANEAACKLARRYGHDVSGGSRYEIVAATNSFHGRTLFTVSVGGQPKYSDGFGPKIEGIRHVPFNDLAALEAVVSDKTCAVILEPIQGEGGVLPADQAYLEGARRLCDAQGALLIFDEVQSGVGRSGHLYAYQHYGVVPDILTTAKSIGGGFPLAAMLTTGKVAQHFSAGVHGSTYGGNPLGCAVGAALLDIVATPETLAGVAARHQRFVAGLEQLNARYSLFEQVRGLGLLIGAVLNDSWKGRAKDIVTAANEEGLMILQAGPDVLRMAPSLIIPEADIDEGLARLDRALARLTQG